MIEPTQAAEEAWAETCKIIADMTLFTKQDSWIFGLYDVGSLRARGKLIFFVLFSGANIPGKKHSVNFYMAGLKAYRGVLDGVKADGWKDFTFGQ